MDKSQILVDIPVLEKAMNISKKFFLELAEGDKEQQQLIEETYS